MSSNAIVEKSSTTWQDTVQTFVMDLDPASRAAFKAPATPNDCIDVLLATQRRRTRLTRILSLMNPAIAPLKRFESAIDVIVQVNAGIASPIWGPLRIVVTLSADHFRTLESIAMIIHKIISSLQRFTKYEELFQKNQLVQDAIGALYCDYLDFCVRITRFYSTSSLRSFFSSFDKDFRDISESIQLHSQNVDWAAQTAHIEEIHREVGEAKAQRRAHERENIQRWLSPATVGDDLQKHLSDYLFRSCDGLLTSPEFQSFVSPGDLKAPQILSLQGLPGSGKTTAAGFIINHLMTKGFEVLCFFFKANDVEKRSLLHCLRSILSHLLRLEEHLYELVEPVYRDSGRAVADSLVEVQRALSAALKHSKANPLFIVLDALDESSNSREITQWVTAQVSSNVPPCLRILVTSRPSLSFSRSSNLRLASLNMGSCETDSLKEYIHSRVQENPIIRDTEVGNQIAACVASAASGLWLYAKLMMDDIDKLPSVGQIQKQLNVLPRGFTELYTQIIRTAEATLSPVELKLAQQLHLWIDTADYLPKFLVLTDDRLSHRMLELIFQYANDGEAVHDLASQASRVSGPLVSVLNPDLDAQNTTPTPTPTTTEPWTFELDFIHQTAAQYLSESSSLPVSQLPATLRPRRLRHLHRAAVAIWYFTSSPESAALLLDLQQQQQQQQQHQRDGHCSPPSLICYFEMAYGLWTALQLDSPPSPQDAREAGALLRKLTDFISGPACLRWVECAIIINYQGKFPHLLWNAVNAWKIAAGCLEDNERQKQQQQQQQQHHYDDFHHQQQDHEQREHHQEQKEFQAYTDFSAARVRFCRNYGFVLAATGVGASSAPREMLESAQEGGAFVRDPLAVTILQLGRRWRRLAFPGSASGVGEDMQLINILLLASAAVGSVIPLSARDARMIFNPPTPMPTPTPTPVLNDRRSTAATTTAEQALNKLENWARVQEDRRKAWEEKKKN
ncbi:uncharacterized protein GGS25DRAFT_525677 [Hypoxylon fragiforme]|uniref:uncharacterized protein n=1 Tax=Hypoxylon fragiforme TaxID=63214 RepID=UPI0020C6B3C2|nr:uncharacterized protein GGS25DRAFT_525677 [Hypoxylon fragiforme]KAI2604392.1 hypothetical protein GGS25DRAFT_525677 [Hypoxylon fragiforme]